MAGDWIKMRKELQDNPHVMGIAAALSLDPDAVIGKLHRLWCWADSHTVDGNARNVTTSWIDGNARVTGFASALQKEGWLKFTENGVLFPNFDEHNGVTAKRRAACGKRVAKHRVTLEALPEKRREEKRRKRDTNVSLPLYSPPFETWWSSYPKKSGKRAAQDSWIAAGKRLVSSGMTRQEAVARLQATCEAFAASPKARSIYVTLPATWLNQGRYDDDPSAWQDDGEAKPAVRAGLDPELFKGVP